MKTKYVCRGLISLYVSFHNNRTMWPTNLHVKICRWGGGKGKRANKSYQLAGSGSYSPHLQVYIIKITVHIVRLL